MNLAKRLLLCAVFILRMTAPCLALEDTAVAGQGMNTYYGTESQDCLSSETAIGDLCADAARWASGADIAILCSGDIGGNLIGGDITYGDCSRVFYDDKSLAVVEITPAQLKDLLETGVAHMTMDEEQMIDREASAWGGFPQISGFEFSYDVAAMVGNRVHEIRLDGVVLDLTDVTTPLKLCATADMLSGGWSYRDMGGGEEVGMTLSEALFYYIQEQETITPPTELQRITPRGSKDDSLWNNLKVTPLLLVIAILVFAGGRKWRYKQYHDFNRF